jgi:signal transduction histidine kinase
LGNVEKKNIFMQNPKEKPSFSAIADSEKECWLQLLTQNPVSCEFTQERDLKKCLECDFFNEFASRSQGRRFADQITNLSVKLLADQVCQYTLQLEKTHADLKKKIEELTILKKVSDALLKSNTLEKSLRLVLTGVTAGEAFGFNRAFIFLLNTKILRLEGALALGPENPSEVEKIWGELKEKKITFDQIIEEILSSPKSYSNALTKRISGIKLPSEEQDNFFTLSFREKKSLNIKSWSKKEIGDEKLASLFCQDGFAVVPIFTESQRIGILIVDNYFTKVPISDEDISALETFANQAANEIEKLILQSELKTKFQELEHIHQLLRENQSYLLQHERLADIGKLATTAAHEIKTPLVTIGGYARRALKNSKAGQSSQRELEIIINEVERLEEITSQILDYSKKAVLNKETKDLNELILEATEMLSDKLAHNNIRLETQLSPGEYKVEIDTKRMKQVIFNLVENAIESMFQGGALRITTKRKDEFVTLEIEDTGCGIPEEELKKLFVPFYTTKPTGSGLGLPVSKKIITDHQGYIQVESQINQGTKFTIYLPAV